MSPLFAEKPYVSVVSAEFFENSNICFTCFKKVPHVKRCAKCHIAAYCGKDCQVKDFETDQHRRECGVFQKLPGNAILKQSEALRLVARIIARKAKDKGKVNPNDLEGFPIQESIRNLDDMQSNKVQVANTLDFEKAWSMFRAHYAGCSNFFASVSQDDFALAMGLAQTNMFSIYDYQLTQEQTHLGSGLYIQSARFNHSCDPDVKSYIDGSTRVVKPLKKVDPNRSLDSLTISYHIASTVTFTETRQNALKQYFFTCECTKCLNTVENDIKKFSVRKACDNCSETLIADPDWKVLKCYNCKTETPVDVDSRDFEAFRYIEELQKAHLGTGHTIDVSPPEYIKEVEKYLHPVKNVYLLHLREEACAQAEQLFKMTEKVDFLKEMYQYGAQIVSSYDFYHLTASSHPVLCAKMAEMAFIQGDKEATITYFQKARDLWSEICHPDYHLVTELNAKLLKLDRLEKKKKGQENETVH